MRGIACVSSLTAALAALMLISAPALSSDANWGKKVRCFVVEETVVCPGCNYRAGLSCPRKLKESQNCLLPSTKSALTTVSTNLLKTTYKEINSTETPYEQLNFTQKIHLDHKEPTTETYEIQKESTENQVDLDMAIYLYQLLTSGGRQYYRYRSKRELLQQEQEKEEEPEICNWNGDCPCPQICCKTGPGCPKRCVNGIRLPPPWG